MKFKVSVVNPVMIKSFRISQAPENSGILTKSLHELLKIVESLTERLRQITNQLENKNLDKIIVNSIQKKTQYTEKEVEKLTKTMMKIVQNNPVLKQKYDLISSIKEV